MNKPGGVFNLFTAGVVIEFFKINTDRKIADSNDSLVIVNYGNASGEEIFQFSEKIQNSVVDKFGIDMEREVTIIE